MVQESFKVVLGSFKRVKCVLRKFQKNVSKVFQECFNEVLFHDFVVEWISSQLPEEKEGLFEYSK